MIAGTKPIEFYRDAYGTHPIFGLSSFADAADILAILGTDWVKDTHVDWGTGAGQVSAADVPIADGGSRYTGTEVETALQELAGSGRTTETVKANATAIALRALASRLISAGVGLTGGGDLSADRTLTLAIPHYETNWLLNEIGGAGVGDWTLVHLGSTPTTNSNVTHNLNAPLSHLLVKLFISTDGTDANSLEICNRSDNPASVQGFIYYAVDNNNLKIQTAAGGIAAIDDAGAALLINTQDWYYKIVVWKLG